MHRFRSLRNLSLLQYAGLFALALALTGCQDDPISSEDQSTATGTSSPATASSAVKCDLIVPDDASSIQAGVTGAEAGETVCVEPGTYEETVEVVTQNVTLHGRTTPQSGNPVVVDGHFSVEPQGAGTTIRRFRITSTKTFEGSVFPHPFGVRVKASDVLVANNVIEDFQADFGKGGFSVHGVQVFGQEPGVSNVTIRDNVIRGFNGSGGVGGIAGVKIQARVVGTTIAGNEITDHHSAGWVWGVVLTSSASAPDIPQDVTIKDNHIAGLNDGSVYKVFAGDDHGRRQAPFPGSAVGIDGGAHADEATVKYNNLLAPNGAESKDIDHTLVAECNWWGARSGPTTLNNTNEDGTLVLAHPDTDIQFTPWLNAPAPSKACIGGTKPGKGPPGHRNGPKGSQGNGPGH